jgi:two-component system response regulator (stage 0 sporulation protein F)
MKKEILIIDDQPGIRMLLTDVLENEGYKVTTAADGKEAVNKLYQHTYNLMIVDYKLPLISGVEILQRLRRDKMEIPTIVISGLAGEIEKELADYHLVKEVLAKPFDIHQLLEMVKNNTS